jgi:hypothetical protein
MKKIVLYTFLILSFSCSNDDKTIDNQEADIELSLTLTSTNSYSASFEYSYSSQLENVILIWNDINEVDLINNIGEVEITQNNSNKTITNLSQSQNYFFKLVGKINEQEYFSDLVTLTTSEIETLYDGQIASSVSTSNIEEIIKEDDGYLIVTGYGDITVHKLDNNFNLLWSTEIVERDTNFFKSIIDLENGEYILFGSGNTNTNLGTYNTKSFAVKIDNSGNKLWTKYFHYADNTDWTFWWNDIVKFKKKGSNIKLLTTVDTTYYNDRLDTFFHEYTLDFDGEIISQKTLPYAFDTFLNIEYDNDGNIYNYGTNEFDFNFSPGIILFNGILEKYDQNNELIWSEHYNDEIFGDDSLDRLLINENYIVNIGKEGNSQEEFRLIHFRNNQGSLLWKFTETRDEFLYQGKDAYTDFDNNILVLYFDIFYPNSHVYNIATLMKFDQDGNLLWRYQDGEDFNQERFTPAKVFNDNGEYLIFGVKDANSLWLKKINVE